MAKHPGSFSAKNTFTRLFFQAWLELRRNELQTHTPKHVVLECGEQ
jgi:hypothetical protein